MRKKICQTAKKIQLPHMSSLENSVKSVKEIILRATESQRKLNEFAMCRFC